MENQDVKGLVNWKRLGRALWENLDNFLTILLCLAAGFYGLLGGKSADAWLLSTITGGLGLIAYGTIKDRKAREKLQASTDRLAKPPRATEVLKLRNEYKSFEQATRFAKKVNMTGASLVNFLGKEEDYLKRMIIENCAEVRIVILDQNSAAIHSAASCQDTNIAEICEEIERTERIVQEICQKCESAKAKGWIELRKICAFPNYTLVVVDSGNSTDFATLELTGYREDTTIRPHIELNPENDPFWFEHYKIEFNRLWNDAAPCIKSAPFP